mmetsp:Transcript_120011/g.340218  ORF Transcript_120011/g.340218 Transcript_120011/m.340218 type:complete len:212 (-) Transcript_120011:1326-1961(-)
MTTDTMCRWARNKITCNTAGGSTGKQTIEVIQRLLGSLCPGSNVVRLHGKPVETKLIHGDTQGQVTSAQSATQSIRAIWYSLWHDFALPHLSKQYHFFFPLGTFPRAWAMYPRLSREGPPLSLRSHCWILSHTLGAESGVPLSGASSEGPLSCMRFTSISACSHCWPLSHALRAEAYVVMFGAGPCCRMQSTSVRANSHCWPRLHAVMVEL